MHKFSLSNTSKALPDSYIENGSAFPVNADFRIILRIFRLLHDPQVLDEDKHAIFLKLFFPGEIPPSPYAAFKWFANCGEETEGTGEKDFDFEQDAMEIFASFMQVYGIDLLECPGMHWWKFSALLSGAFVQNTALNNKISLRHIDDSEAKRKSDLHNAKQRAAICEKMSVSDRMLENEMKKRLMNGDSIADLLGR